MSTDNNGLEDELDVQLNGDEEEAYGGIPAEGTLKERPSDSAPRSKWAEYCISLGADENYINNPTEHWDDSEQEYVIHSKLTQEQLMEYAAGLGG